MTHSEWASRIWPVLLLAARNRQVLTYEILSRLVGKPRHTLGASLEPIQSYCLLRRLPPLTGIVVSERTGLPGKGFIAAADLPKEQMMVFTHPWDKEHVPTAMELAATLKKRPSNGVK